MKTKIFVNEVFYNTGGYCSGTGWFDIDVFSFPLVRLVTVPVNVRLFSTAPQSYNQKLESA